MIQSRWLRAFAGIALVLALAIPIRAFATPATGYWWNGAEPGRGFVIEIQGNQMFMAAFLYDVTGRATWVASFGPMLSSTQYMGSLVTYSGGETLTGTFQPATQSPTPLGNIAINFTSDTTGTVTWPGGTVPIKRFDFGPGGSLAVPPVTNPESGWWWNPSEGGRGFAIEVQGGAMYFAGYMYDTSGNPLWYLSSGNITTSPLAFVGTWSQFGNGQTLTGTYRAPIIAVGNVGGATLQFTGTHSATLTLPNFRQIPLARFPFGVSTPKLTAFSPASAAPGSLLTLFGTGLDPSGALTVTLTDDAGSYSVTIPPVAVTASAIQLAVPPYVVSLTGSFGSRSVNVKATQKSSGVSLDTNQINGFTIQNLPSASSGGSATLSLIRASLSEAQRLQTAVQGTSQGTPAVLSALAAQVSSLQVLVNNVQSVIQQGIAFEFGVVGGLTITVTGNNIGDVDRLLLATMQTLANQGSGSLAKQTEANGLNCLGAEASALAAAMTAGNLSQSALDQLAVNLVQAANKSTSCNTLTSFTSAYQTVGGASGSGYGITNGSNEVTLNQRLPGVSLFATVLQNTQPALGLNALLSPALSAQAAASAEKSPATTAITLTPVQNVLVSVATNVKPVTDIFLAKTSGKLVTNFVNAQNVIGTVAPSPTFGTTGGGGVINLGLTGTWSGSWGWIQSASQGCVFNDGGALSMNIVQSGSTISGTNVAATGFQIRDLSSCALQYVDSATGGTFSGSLSGTTITFSASLPLVQFGSPFVFTTGTATYNSLAGTITGNFTAFNSPGSFTLVRQ